MTSEDNSVSPVFVELYRAVYCKCDTSIASNENEKRNEEGETALHIATKNTDLYFDVDLLINKGANVNATNYWGQTPLHYAAQSRSEKIICRLLREENIDVNQKDANGYTALHYSAISSTEIDVTWVKCLDLFVNAGIDINCTTNTGESVLHQISRLYDEKVFLFLFEHILSKYSKVNLFLTNLEGKTFLHTWLLLHHTNLHIFKAIVKYQNIKTVKALLNQKDLLGISPWMEIVQNEFTTIKDLEELFMSYGALLNATDNMENTLLHILVSYSSTEQNLKKMEMLVKQGIDVNAKNIFGQTALSFLDTEDTFDVLRNFEIDWCTRDRWNRTLFFEILSKKSYPSILLKMLDKHKDYIEEDDVFHSTPLHVAAYGCDVWKVKLLLKFTEKTSVCDQMGDTPALTALRHGNFECYQRFDNTTTHYIPTTSVNVTSLKGQNDIRELLDNFPKDMNSYAECLLQRKQISYCQIADNKEDTEIISEVNNLVSRICDAVESYDARFKMSVFKTGSIAEGTKVGKPDEFDFALCVESLSEICDAEFPTNTNCLEFTRLRFKENIGTEYITFSNENRYFVALPFLQYLFRYLRRAVTEKKLWVYGNVFMKPNSSLNLIAGKPVFNFDIFWNGSKYKQLKISIDLLPVVYKHGWWPSSILTNTRKLLTKSVEEAGCFVTLETKLDRFKDSWYTIKDNINETCKRINKSRGISNLDHLFLRVSVAPAEIVLMRSLPGKFKKAYTLAKIVIMQDVCPAVRINKFPSYFEQPESNYLPVVHSYDEIKSYWLKNSVLYVAEQILTNDIKEKTLLDITRLIYEKLLEFATTCQLNAYLLPHSDIFEKEKKKSMSIKEVHTLLLNRKVSIDTVLGILGKPFPEDNSEWILKCTNMYNHYELTKDLRHKMAPTIV